MTDTITITAIVSATVGFVSITGLTTTLLGRRIDDVRDTVKDLRGDMDRRFDQVDRRLDAVSGAVIDLGTRVTRLDRGTE